jgi:hypothetical protein
MSGEQRGNRRLVPAAGDVEVPSVIAKRPSAVGWKSKREYRSDGACEVPRRPHWRREPQGGARGKAKVRVSKLKYTCPTCAANAWGKPGLLLRCGECDAAMACEPGADADACPLRAA